jgi:hypothetical protein
VHDTNTCQVCSAPAGDRLNLCITHTDDLLAGLGQVPDLVAELDVTITRQNRTTAGRNGSRSTTRPLAWNEHASIKASELWSTLSAWALDVSKRGEDERDPLADVDTYDTPGVSDWIRRNISTLRQHPEAGTAHEELIDAIRQARRAIDRPADEVAYGKCLNDEDLDEPCQLYLYGPPGKDYVHCRGCGARHSTSARREWMLDHIRGMTGTAVEVSGFLKLAGVKVTVDAVRGMAARGRILSVGVGKNDRALYRCSDVIAAAGERYKRKGKRGGADAEHPPDLQRSNPAA